MTAFFMGFVTVLVHFLESQDCYLRQRMMESVVQLLRSVRTWFSVCRLRTALMEMSNFF